MCSCVCVCVCIHARHQAVCPHARWVPPPVVRVSEGAVRAQVQPRAPVRLEEETEVRRKHEQMALFLRPSFLRDRDQLWEGQEVADSAPSVLFSLQSDTPEGRLDKFRAVEICVFASAAHRVSVFMSSVASC